MDISTWIRSHRTRRCLTQVDLADHLGVNRITIVLWEGGQRIPGEAQSFSLAEWAGEDPQEVRRMIIESRECKGSVKTAPISAE